ncbi:DNA polymerase III subunit alpha [Saccharococcus thermophilus]|uniref:DNA polymerase III subunit alpha n=1 Tax=Saccharococcus thermophilus TaxID=29396 RepID=A0A846MJE0_9BACL|nr:DNA polymerase III subunit alpha [Saccharococcus thermophilus]NIK15721.1 DNA polymerase-3 subunit alpha [Saccharococcus thermophilus]
MSFVHLHVRSCYSLLTSPTKISDLVKKAKELQFSALALTDENVLYGAIPFYIECKRYGIQPIIGMITDIALEGESAYPLVLLAKNETGYRHLMKISSTIQTKTQEGIPEKFLWHYRNGLIALTPGKSGQIETLLADNEIEKAKQVLERYKQIFGTDVYLSVQRREQEREPYEAELIRLGEETSTPLVATNDVQYIEKEDVFVQRCLLAIKHGTEMKEEKNVIGERYFTSSEEMEQRFSDLPEALANSKKIADQCHLHLEFDTLKLPKYPVPEKESAGSYLRRLCLKGLNERVSSPSDVYRKRLEYELHIIEQMHFSDYFLIVWDLMNFARKKGITTGPGRGSAAGSLVAYTLYITDVDPIQYGLLFERFLNPERVSMPDIDIDFPDDRREEVIQYVAAKYGQQHVAQIITFGTFGAKAALRDVGKAMGIHSQEVEPIIKSIPNKPGVTIQEVYEQSPAFRQAVQASSLLQKWMATAMKIEGLPRHTSTHAAGVIISSEPLAEMIPLQQGHGEWYLTQYPMDVLERLGLLKMDFLGLRTLTFLEHICRLIERQTGKSINIRSLPLDDRKTYELLSNGDTNGIFQLESEGMKHVLRELKPSQFEDIVAVNALYRPGPMSYIPVYIKRKHGEEHVSYLHPDLEPILAPTYGVLIYQEQIMQIAANIAGFSLGKADLLRRAVAKKKKELLDEQRREFVQGCLQNGYEETFANELYDMIVRFANYGFNRSHAVSYALLSYQLAYLKAHYPLCFYAALLTSVIGDEEKLSLYIYEARQKQTTLLPPAINRSRYAFSVEQGKIRYSLAAIKHVGTVAVKAIIQERQRGEFADFFDFCVRLFGKGINRKTIESLILSGCFDEFGVERASLLASVDVALEHAQLMGPYMEEGLLADLSLKPKYVEAPALSLEEKLEYEKELLGVYISPHPTSAYQKAFRLAGAKPILSVCKSKAGSLTKVGVYIAEKRKTRTKRGEEMAFFTISDESGEMVAVAFPEVYSRYSSALEKGNVQLLEGKLDVRAGKPQLVIRQVLPLDTKALYIKIRPEHMAAGKLFTLKALLRKYHGNTPVFLYYEQEQKMVKLAEEYNVSLTDESIAAFKELFGHEHIVVK